MISSNSDCIQNEKQDSNDTLRYEITQYLGTRENQQDSIGVIESKEWMLAVLADGIGGMEKGEIASKISVNEVLKSIRNKDDKKFLLNAFQNADDQMQKFIEENNLKSSGSTLIATYIVKNKFYMCSIGDSFFYLYRNHKLKQLNQRHNYEFFLNTLLKENKISPQDYVSNINKRELLISYIGKGNLSIINFFKEGYSLEKDDVIILCSDGLLSAISEEKLLEVIEKNNNPVTINKTLMNLVYLKKNKNQDNTSIITIHKYR